MYGFVFDWILFCALAAAPLFVACAAARRFLASRRGAPGGRRR